MSIEAKSSVPTYNNVGSKPTLINLRRARADLTALWFANEEYLTEQQENMTCYGHIFLTHTLK